MRPESVNIGRRINLKKLINNLVYKLNDPKQIVRIEVERLIVDIAGHMKSQEAVMQLLEKFESRRLTEIGKRAIL